MNASQLIELMNRTPFEPLVMHLSNGTVIHVDQPYYLWAKPNTSTCIVFDDEGIARFVSYQNIAEIVTRHPTAEQV